MMTFRNYYLYEIYETIDLINPPQNLSAFAKKERPDFLDLHGVKLMKVSRRKFDVEKRGPWIDPLSYTKETKRGKMYWWLADQVLLHKELHKTAPQKAEADPTEKFEPSVILANLLYNHLDLPDDKEVRSFNLFRKLHGKPAIDRPGISELKTIISREVEGLLANLAKRSEVAETQIFISKKGRLTQDICIELIDRLQLDVRDTLPIFNRLYDELFQFVSQIPRNRSWGQIAIEDSDLVLKIGRGALEFPDFGSLDEEGWIEL